MTSDYRNRSLFDPTMPEGIYLYELLFSLEELAICLKDSWSFLN